MLLADIINNKEQYYNGDLRHYFRALFNSRAANNSYHNIRHSCTVFINTYNGLRESFFKLKEETQQYRWYQDSDFRDITRALLVASLLHDYNHSGRAGNDDLNIELSIRGFTKICLDEDKKISRYVEDYIRCTEFGPNGHIHTAPTEFHRILRDADLTQICSDAWIRMVIFGLADEMNISPIEMLRMQEGFLSKVRFESAWGQRFIPKIQEKIQESRELLKILDENGN